jgi:hemoglobin-like flavoprotein
MPLTDDQIDLLHEGLRIMQDQRDLAAQLFYPRLFELAPETRPLFGDDIVTQTEKVLFAFGAVVAQIQNVEACRQMTADLALRHLAYGVERAHYDSVGHAVMSVLAEVLGEKRFTPEMEAAWETAYAEIAAAMIAAAYGPQERPAA